MNEPKPASFTDIAFETGVIAERERIIKLLKERYADHVGIDNLADAAEIDQAIALIKGENK